MFRFKTPTREEILSGPALRTMAQIGAPAALSALIFTLYNLADAFWVGRLPAAEAGAALAGIQVSWPLVWLLISFVFGFGGATASAQVVYADGTNTLTLTMPRVIYHEGDRPPAASARETVYDEVPFKAMGSTPGAADELTVAWT
jgi:hypothetical protein